MAYKKNDFNGCMFNPLTDGENMLSAYERLNEIVLPEWLDADTDSIIRFIICVYDPKSPLFLTERDLNYRKGIAAELSGFDMQDSELLNSVYTCTHSYFVELTMRFLTRFIKSKEFAAIVIVENCFWESCQKLMEPISGKNSKEELEAVQKKSVIKDELDKDILRLDRYYKAFYGEDLELETRAKSKMTPEAMAKRLQNV
jgi:hypothetical protein